MGGANIINKKLNRKNLSSLIVSFLVVLLLALPFFFIVDTVSKEAYTAYILTRQKVASGNLVISDCAGKTDIACKIVNYVEEKFKDPQIRYYLDNSIKHISNSVITGASNLILLLPTLILNFFIIVFVMFLFRFFFRFTKQRCPTSFWPRLPFRGCSSSSSTAVSGR